MSLQTLKKLPISCAAVCLINSTGYGAAVSTVSPYIQEAQIAITAQITTGMMRVNNKIASIKDMASQKFEPEYDLKEKRLKNIKTLQAQNLLLLKKTEADFGKAAEIRSNTNLIEANGVETSLFLGEKDSVLIQSEKFN